VAVIDARGLRKTYGATVALDHIDLQVEEGRIVGLIGANGAGKTTALNALVGLTPYEGQVRVLGRNPWTERARLACDLCFITDVAVLPRWIRVSEALDFVAGVHPRFDRRKAEAFLQQTTIHERSRVRELSKGMIAQLHLAMAMAIDARLLILDEPTLGLDLLYRKQFYDTLLADYLERGRTVLVATHQVEEVQGVLTDVVFIDRGRIVFNRSMETIESEFHEVLVHPARLAEAEALHPFAAREGIGQRVLMFEGVDPARLSVLGEVRTPSIGDLFVAVMSAHPSRAEGAVTR